MKSQSPNWLRRNLSTLVGLTIVCGACMAAWFTHSRWLPPTQQWIKQTQARWRGEVEATPVVDESPHDHGDLETHSSLAISPKAWKNLGLLTSVVKASDFQQFHAVPAVVVERPGRSRIDIASPMTGVVTEVFPFERQAIEPGDPLFTLRLTHEDVVTAQSEFLRQLQALDVVERELARLNQIGEDIIPGKRIVEQQYDRDRTESALASMRQSMLLHGLTEQQIADIEANRRVLRDVTVVAPQFSETHEIRDLDHRYHVNTVAVNRGEGVTAGQLMGTLADHCLLYLEGIAFEEDTETLIQASQQQTKITVLPVAGEPRASKSLELQVQSVADEIDRETRALKFYLSLPNQIVSESIGEHGAVFVSWKYRPGQRMTAQVPSGHTYRNKIVLPAEAVVVEGPNAYLFEQNGDHFDRLEVQVLYRDQSTVVIEREPALLGATIAVRGAFQMQVALKNQAGGAVDPHAGHNH